MVRYRFLSALLLLLSCACLAATLRSVELKGQRFSVEIAATEAARERGLMNRAALPVGHGMLFVYPDARPRRFWMKNTLIPLDILFFDAQRRLINVAARALPCRAEPCRTYDSAAPAQYVLELNAGAAQRLGLRPGDRFVIRPMGGSRN